jgi:hypothetical protein
MEVVITTGIFSVLVLALFAVMQFGIRSWKNIESKNAVQTQLRKVELFLLEDLKRASYNQLRVANMLGTWSPGNSKSLVGLECSGSAVWFLSAMDDSGTWYMRDADGNPTWQRNVLYYIARPADAWHQAKYGYLCGAGGDRDTVCPHKWLIRKEIQSSTLLDEVAVTQYLSRPAGYDLMDPGQMGSEPGLKRVQTLADSVVDFWVTLRKPEVQADLKAFRILEAGSVMHIGQTSLDSDSFTVHYSARVVPNN